MPSQVFHASSFETAPVVRDSFGVEQLAVAQIASTSFSSITGSLAMWPSSAPVNDGFGYRDGGEFHGGLDIMAGSGAPIVAASPGVVETVTQNDSWGQYVKIDHGGGVSTLYAHMIAGSPTVSVGQTVNAGDLIGLTGDTGYVTVAHLHFEVYVGGGRVDPYGWLP